MGVSEEQPRGRVWGLVVAGIVEILAVPVVLVAGAAVLKAVAPAAHAALWIGVWFVAETFLVVLAVWAVLYFAFIRSRAPRRGLAYLLILFAVSVLVNGSLVGLVAWGSKREAARSNQAEAAAQRLVLGEADRALTVIFVKNDGAVDLHTGGTDEASRVARATKALLHGVFGARNAFSDALNAADLAGPISLKQFGSDRHFVKLRAAVNTIGANFDIYDGAIDSATASWRSTVVGAKIDETLKRPTLARFDALAAADKAKRIEQKALIARLMGEMRTMLDEMERGRASWSVESDHLVFQDTRLMARFRAHTAVCRSLLDEARKLGT